MLLWRDRQEAEDAVQEAYLEAARRWDDVRSYDDPEGWVRLVMTQRVKKARLAWLRRRTLEIQPSPVATVEETAQARQALAAICRLPERQRQVLVLHCLQGMLQQEIADLTGLTRGGVAASLSKARTRLAKELGLDVAEDGDGGPSLLPSLAVAGAAARPVDDPLTTMLRHAEKWLAEACTADPAATERMLAEIKEKP
jgi:RNA polymerase sigma-70 factor (ECF subfamily)